MIAPKPWDSLSMDFISQLPPLKGYDSILVVVDRFSKISVFIKTHMTASAKDLANLCVEHVFSKIGLPSNITCNIFASHGNMLHNTTSSNAMDSIQFLQ